MGGSSYGVSATALRFCGICTNTARSTMGTRRCRIGRKAVRLRPSLVLASSADARRGLYVDVTRAREDVTIAYGKDIVRDFGDVLVRVQRDNGKLLVPTL